VGVRRDDPAAGEARRAVGVLREGDPVRSAAAPPRGEGEVPEVWAPPRRGRRQGAGQQGDGRVHGRPLRRAAVDSRRVGQVRRGCVAGRLRDVAMEGDMMTVKGKRASGIREARPAGSRRGPPGDGAAGRDGLRRLLAA
jgi:hypothetical protein